MTWYIENGMEIEGDLAPFFTREQLRAGQKVQIIPSNGDHKLKRATITRVHAVDTHGQQGTIYREKCSSSDGGEITEDCTVFDHACIHVRYGNGVRAVIRTLALVRPANSAVDQLGALVSADAAS
jgi:hypothetical protein